MITGVHQVGLVPSRNERLPAFPPTPETKAYFIDIYTFDPSHVTRFYNSFTIVSGKDCSLINNLASQG